MDYIFAIAGIPKLVFDDVKKKFSQIAPGNCRVIARPQNGQTYSSSDVDYYSKQFAQIIDDDHHNRLHQTKFALIYIDYSSAETLSFVSAFAPHILPAKVSWNPDIAGTRTEIAQSKNQLIESLKSSVDNVKGALHLLRKEVGEKSNKTPLLLPLKNFTSKVLNDNINNLYYNIANADDKQSLIDQALRVISNHHPPQLVSGSKPCFVDDKDISFKSPGKSLHGLSRANTNHPSMCLISANVRLGSKYPKAFHYDCIRGARQQPLTGNFFGCHGGSSSHRTGNPHLNISPNDHIR